MNNRTSAPRDPILTAPVQWLRSRFLAGVVVTVPLFVSIAALVWLFDVVDGITAPLFVRLLGHSVPGLGLVTTIVVLVLVGVAVTNVIGSELLERVEGYLLRVPVFKTVYAPLKQLAEAFSPETERGFQRVVIVEYSPGRFALGFLTKEFALDRGGQAEQFVAVYVPTNHVYLGDVIICRRDAVLFPDMSVDEGIRVTLTGGMGLPDHVTLLESGDPRIGAPRENGS